MEENIFRFREIDHAMAADTDLRMMHAGLPCQDTGRILSVQEGI